MTSYRDGIPTADGAGLRLRRWLEWTGIVGLLTFSLGLVAGPDLIPAGQTLMVVALIPALPRIWRSVFEDRLFQLSLAFIVFLGFYAAYLAWGPDPQAEPTDGLDQFLQAGFLPTLLIAFWWAKLIDEGRTSWPLWAFAAGFYIRLATQWHQEDWSQGIPEKIGFGLYYNPFSMFCGLVMAWWLVVAFNLQPAHRRRPLILLVVALAFSLPLLGWLYALSRGGMLAFLVALVFILYLQVRQHRETRDRARTPILLTVIVIVAGLVFLGGPMMERFSKERAVLDRFLEKGAEEFVPERVSSIGTRFVIWREGIELWMQKPIFGQGPGSTKHFLDELRAQYRIDKPTDFESTYLELLVRIGLAGSLFYLAHFWLCMSSYRSGVRGNLYSVETAQFLPAAAIIFGIAIFFREGLLDPRGRNFASFVLAGLYLYQARKFWFSTNGNTKRTR